MNTTEKFDRIFDFLNITNIELSRISGVDPSLVSRYRNGSRQPNASSAHFTKLCDGIATYAIQNDKWLKLQSLFQISQGDNPTESILCYFLNLSSKQDTSEPFPPNSNLESKIFGDKLTLLMDILNVSNAVLAKALCVDPSLISRMKNGKRIPKKNNDLIENICIYFHKKILSKCLTTEIGNILNISPEDCKNGGKNFVEKFSNWLLNAGTENNSNLYNSYTNKSNIYELPDLQHAHPDYDRINSINVTSTFSKFCGHTGVQNALIAIIKKAIAYENCTIKFYCDNDTKWFFNASPDYHASIIHLFHLLNTKNTSYEAIYSFNQDLTVSRQGMQKWLALIMTGLIKGYIAPNSIPGLFNNTIVVIPNVAGIYSICVAGSENESVYFYTEDPETVSYLNNQFEIIKKKSKPFTQIISRHTFDDYMLLWIKYASASGITTIIDNNLLIETMPPDLFSRIINRSSIKLTQADKERLIKLQQFFCHHFQMLLKHSIIYELISFPDPQDVKEGKVHIALTEFLIKETIPYSAEDYSEHIQNIIRLLDNEDYHIIPLFKYPLQNFGIYMKETSVVSIRIGSELILNINQPDLINGFNDFLRSMTKEYIIQLNSKDEIIQFLSRYINIK